MTIPTATLVLQDKPKISKHETGPGQVQKVIQPPKVPSVHLARQLVDAASSRPGDLTNKHFTLFG